MDSSLSTIRGYCCKGVQSCKSFLVVHRVDIITYTTDILIGHPFIVLRRQCQVRGDSQTYHITPFTLMPVVITLVQRKGFKILFKGLAGVVVLRTVQLGVEEMISKLTKWPTKLPPTWHVNKDWLLHFLLKSSSLIITAPLYSLSVINTVSVPGGFTNNHFLTFQKYDFPLPVWQTTVPTAAFGVLKYAFTQATLSFSVALLYLNHCFNETERASWREETKDGVEFEDRQDIFLKTSIMSYLLAEVVFYPFETIVHRLIIQGTETFTNDLDCGSAVVQVLSAHDGFGDCWDNVMWLEGKLGLYKGFGALLMQAFIYHYCIKFVSFTWHHIIIYKKRYCQFFAPTEITTSSK